MRHRVVDDPPVDEPDQDDVAAGREPLLEEVQRRQGVEAELRGGGHVRDGVGVLVADVVSWFFFFQIMSLKLALKTVF